MSHYNLAVLHRTEGMDEVERLLEPFNEDTEEPEYLTFEEDPECGLNAQTGLRGRFVNKNAKWDWYVPGGRWRGQLRLKPSGGGRYVEENGNPAYPDDPTRCDSAKIKDIDFSPQERLYLWGLRQWEIAVEGSPHAEAEENKFRLFFKPEYYQKLYGDKESYARQMSEFSTYAYLTPDGVWHETGKMGWFGISDETMESRAAYREAFMRDVINGDPELYLTIIDCHI